MGKIKNKKIIVILLGVFAIIIVAALLIYSRKQMANNTVSASSGAQEEYRDFEKPTEEQWNNGKLNVCFITKSYGSGYWETLIQGAIDGAEQNNVNLYLAGVAKESSTERLAILMEEALEMEPDAIVVSPADTARINSVVDKINEKGIPLVFVDTILNGRKFDACYMTDNMQAGRMVGWNMLGKLKAAGYKESDTLSIGIDIGSKQSQTIIERLAGFNEYWSNNAPSNWKVITTIKCNEGSADVAYTQCLEFMDQNSDLAGLIGLNNGSTVGLCRGILERERKDIVLVGFDYSDDIAALIEGGEYYASTMVQLQYNMGMGSINTVAKICAGEEPEFRFYNTGVSKVDHENYNNPYIKAKVLRK